MHPKVEVTIQILYNFKISSKHILLSKNNCPISRYISQHVKRCLMKNCMKYRKHVWNLCNELIIAIFEHLMRGIWITSATGHLLDTLSQTHRHSTLPSSKFNSTEMRLTDGAGGTHSLSCISCAWYVSLITQPAEKKERFCTTQSAGLQQTSSQPSFAFCFHPFHTGTLQWR